MAWDDGNNKDPWRSRGNQGPADLDAIVRDLQRKLGRFFGGRGGGGDDRQGPGPRVGAGLLTFVVVAAAGVWALFGFFVVDEAERGIILRFGEYARVEEPGLRWHLPWPIETVAVINTDESLRLPYEGSMLTRDENIVDISLVVQFRRSDPESYLFSLREPEATLEDVTASAIREVIGKNDLEYILTDGRLEIAFEAQELLQSTLDSYNSGMTVYEVNLQEASFPTEVQPSVQDVVMAREDRTRLIFEAETYRNQRLPEARGEAARLLENAEGYRSQVVANAEGETERFLQILREYSRQPEITRERIYLETIEDVYANSAKVFVDAEGGNNLLYLPLDQLVQRREAIGGAATGSSASGSVAGSASVESQVPSRSSVTPSVRR